MEGAADQADGYATSLFRNRPRAAGTPSTEGRFWSLKQVVMSLKATATWDIEVHVRKRALVTGGAGQDGWYLIELLLSHGYEVSAHSRRQVDPSLGRVAWHTGDLTDETFLKNLLSISKPDEIYNLAAVSRPALSWDIPIETAL